MTPRGYRPQKFVNVGSGDGLLSDDTWPLAEPNLVKYKWDPVAVIWGSYLTENAADINNWKIFENCANKITSYDVYIYLIYSGKTHGISPNVHKPFKSAHFISINLESTRRQPLSLPIHVSINNYGLLDQVFPLVVRINLSLTTSVVSLITDAEFRP